MQQINIRSATVKVLRQEMGQALESFVDQWGDKAEFAKEAGINRATLYRLLDGHNVGSDTLFRVLRTLGRFDVIGMLIEPSLETPIQKLSQAENKKNLSRRKTEGGSYEAVKPVFEPLKLGKKKKGNGDV